jgi:CRISPR-associated protein Csm3
MTVGIVEKVFLRGTLTALTGVRVGGTDQGLSVGGLQNIVIRHTLLNEPYLPGSSIRGKLRCLLERLQGRAGHGHGDMIDFGPCDDPKVRTVQLFGTEAAALSGGSAGKDGAERTATIPSRLLVRDALLKEESRKQLARLRGDLPMTETKTEVCIDRVTSAANPRTFERVPAGAQFGFELVLEVRALPKAKGTDDPRDKVLEILNADRNEGNRWGRDEDLTWILTGLDLLQDDALGGQGSRGYGRVKVELETPTVRTRKDYLEGTKGQDLDLAEASLDGMFAALNQRGAAEQRQILASIPGASA